MSEIRHDTQTLAELLRILGLDKPALRTERLDGKPCELVNEAGVYVLMFHSQIEPARQFRKWVRLQFLPDTHRSGLTNELRRSFQIHAASVLGCDPSIFASGKMDGVTL
jgi:prophage antirepressor-like protein